MFSQRERARHVQPRQAVPPREVGGVSRYKLLGPDYFAYVLGTFEKLRRATVSFIMSVCPSVSMELSSHWTDFDETWYLRVFWKSVEKIQILLKSGKYNGYFTWKRCHIYDNISLNSS